MLFKEDFCWVILSLTFRGCSSEIAVFSNFENPSSNPHERCDFDSENTFRKPCLIIKNVQRKACDDIAWRIFTYFILQPAGLGLFKIFFTDTIKNTSYTQ